MPQGSPSSETSVMGWGNRGWIEIVEIILEICQRGALKTHIMYKCNLNSKQIAQYMRFLETRRLIDIYRETPSSKRPIFITSELGRKYMDAYKQLENIFKKN